MKCAAYLLSIFLLVTALPAAAGKKDVSQSIARAVVGSSQPAKSNEVVQPIASQVAEKGYATSSSDDDDNDFLWDLLGCLIFKNCDDVGAVRMTFDDAQWAYRHFTDTELWEICLGKRDDFLGYRRSIACSMLGSPNPLRPVEVRSRLEHADAPFVVDDSIEEPAPHFAGEYAVAPCDFNATLSRKRPVRDCAAEVTPGAF